MSESNVVQDASVQELVTQRDQLRGWIARLDEVGSQAAGHVAQRVRADYESRLQRVTEALSTHGEEIERDRTRAGETVTEVLARRTEASDRLEEQRLRHMIGEISGDEWERAHPELEREVSEADDALAAARAELERLETLAAEIGAVASSAPQPPRAEAEPVQAQAPAPEGSAPGGEAADDDEAESWEPQMEEAQPPAEVRPPEDAPPSSDDWDPFGGEFGADAAATAGDAADDLPWLNDLESGSKSWDAAAAAEADDDGLDFLKSVDPDATQAEPPAAPRPAAPSDAELGDDDLAFLEELDRAISSSPTPATPPAAQASGDAGPPATGGKPGSKAEPLLCKECGAINEPHAWYCEICGSEL